jgi:hypothetical protein
MRRLMAARLIAKAGFAPALFWVPAFRRRVLRCQTMIWLAAMAIPWKPNIAGCCGVVMGFR